MTTIYTNLKQTASYRREHPWAAKLCVAVKTKKDIILKKNFIDFLARRPPVLTGGRIADR